jgi:outer membrane protein assembly factor BamB
MKTRILACSTLLLMSFVLSEPGAGQEWTRFRGPNGQGVSKDRNVTKSIPVTWTEDDVNWRTTLPGIGHGSPSLWGEHLFLISGDPATAERLVLCVDTATGRIRWKRSFASTFHRLHKRNSYASSTPAVDAGRVYVAWADLEKTTLMALSHDGKPEWEIDLGPFVSQHGFGTSPMIHDGMVILSMLQQGEELDGKNPGVSFAVAVDCETGEIRWKTPRRSVFVSYSVPAVYRPGKGPPELIFCSTAHGLYSLDPTTGREKWSIDVFGLRTISSPVITDDFIIGTCGAGRGGNYLVAVRPPSATRPAEEVYRVTSNAAYVPTPVVAGDLMFFFYDKGIVCCVRTGDGSIVWRERLGGGFSGSPVRVGDRIYCISDEGDVVVLAAAEKFTLLGRTSLGDRSRATPAVAGGHMYLRTYSSLVSVGGK